MKKIKKYVKHIDDELESAEMYAEMYIEAKAEGNNNAGIYREFAQNELDHCTHWHELAVKYIQKVSEIFQAPADMREKWDASHLDYIEKTSSIKSMLGM